ncbi:MAG: hypothetical protein L0Z62_41160 [Gemmataceae bacterium]|nr:hypothetical protein [Gemmataceae bacterium]
MTVLTADEVLMARLRGVVEPVEIRDPAGKVLGHYTPARTPEEAAFYSWAKQTFDLEAAERAAADPRPGYTLEEVKERLRSLETKG